MSIHIEYKDDKVLATFDTAEEAAHFARLLMGTRNGGSPSQSQISSNSEAESETRTVLATVRSLRDRQRSVLRAIMDHNWIIGDTALREALGLEPPAFGGLLAGITKSINASGLDARDILDRRTTEAGSVQYLVPARAREEVRRALTE